MNGRDRTGGGGDALTPVERALLDAGRAYQGTPETRARTLAALGLATSAAVAGAAGAASVSAAAKLTWTKLLLGVTLVGSVAAVPGGYYLLRHRQAPPSASAIRVAVRTPPFRPAVAGEGATPGRPLAAPVRAQPLPLGEELAAVDGAHAALAAGDAERALALLDAYDRAHPHGRLELEAEVLRIDALAKSGHPDAARARAEAFLRRHPNSVLAARARGYTGR